MIRACNICGHSEAVRRFAQGATSQRMRFLEASQPFLECSRYAWTMTRCTNTGPLSLRSTSKVDSYRIALCFAGFGGEATGTCSTADCQSETFISH